MSGEDWARAIESYQYPLGRDHSAWGSPLQREQWRTMIADYTNAFVTDINRQVYGAEERTPSMDSEQERIVRELEELGARPRVLSEQCREENQVRQRRLSQGGVLGGEVETVRVSDEAIREFMDRAPSVPQMSEEAIERLLTPAEPRPRPMRWQPRIALREEIDALLVTERNAPDAAHYADGVRAVIDILETRGIL